MGRGESSDFFPDIFPDFWEFGRCNVLPCVAKICAEPPVFARVVGELGAADPRIYSKGPIQANASSEAQPEGPG